MDSPCIKQTVCKVLKIFQYGKYLVAYVLKYYLNKLFELFAYWVILHSFLSSPDFFSKSTFFKNYFRNTNSECQTAWIQIRTDILFLFAKVIIRRHKHVKSLMCLLLYPYIIISFITSYIYISIFDLDLD